jgi:hypothetical protein
MEQKIQIGVEEIGGKCDLDSSGSYERANDLSLSLKCGKYLRS